MKTQIHEWYDYDRFGSQNAEQEYMFTTSSLVPKSDMILIIAQKLQDLPLIWMLHDLSHTPGKGRIFQALQIEQYCTQPRARNVQQLEAAKILNGCLLDKLSISRHAFEGQRS